MVNVDGADVAFQVDPTCHLLNLKLQNSCYQLHFVVELGPLEIKRYTVINKSTDINTK